MFFITTSIVWFSSSVGLNSTISVSENIHLLVLLIVHPMGVGPATASAIAGPNRVSMSFLLEEPHPILLEHSEDPLQIELVLGRLGLGRGNAGLAEQVVAVLR
jgi:hypothetical protein